MAFGLFPPSSGPDMTLQSILIHDKTVVTSGLAGVFDDLYIPFAFEHLMIYSILRTAFGVVTDTIGIFFNGDYTSSNYNTQRFSATDSGSASDRTDSSRFLLAAGTLNTNAENFAVSSALLPFHQRPGYTRTGRSECYQGATASNCLHFYALEWESREQVTSISIRSLSGSTFMPGSRIQIFGQRVRPMPLAGM